jgi:hypothetical protein
MVVFIQKNMKSIKLKFTWFCLLLVFSSFSYADSLFVLTGESVNSNLIDLPAKSIKGDLEFEGHKLTGIGYQKDVAHPSFIASGLDYLGIDGAKSSLELMAVQHYPQHSLLENVVAYHIKSRPFDWGWTKLTLGLSIGLSYVHGTPAFDDGSKDASNKKYRLLNYNAYEASFWNQKEDSAVFFRIHHRSGMYGLIAPEGVGSNFLTLGIKRAWK